MLKFVLIFHLLFSRLRDIYFKKWKWIFNEIKRKTVSYIFFTMRKLTFFLTLYFFVNLKSQFMRLKKTKNWNTPLKTLLQRPVWFYQRLWSFRVAAKKQLQVVIFRGQMHWRANGTINQHSSNQFNISRYRRRARDIINE